jgi:hypothetical protein
MKLVAVIASSTEIREITVEAEDSDAARDAIEAMIPEGWRLLYWRTRRDS